MLPSVSWREFVLGAWAAGAPLLLLLSSSEWFFNATGYVDAWQYVGLFQHYDNPDYLRGAYKLARLPWIISGWIVHRIAPAEAAAYLLHGGFLVAATSGFFLLTVRLFDSVPLAALAAMLLGFSPQFHGSGGWDYHNTGAGTFYIWTLVAVTTAARTSSRRAMFTAGVLAALTAHSNITFVNLLPIVAIHYAVLVHVLGAGWGRPTRQAAEAMALALAGALTVTLVFAGVNMLVGRDPLFFLPLLKLVMRFTSNPENQAVWWQPWSSGWVLRAIHLALPAAVLVGATAAVWTRMPAVHRLVVAEFIAAAALWVTWQSAGQTALNFDYFAYPLLPHAFLAMAALVPVAATPVRPLVLIAVPLILAAPLVLRSDFAFLDLVAVRLGGLILPPFALVVCSLAALHLPVRGRFALFLALYACGNTLSAPAPAAYDLRSTCRLRLPTYLAAVEANRLVASAEPNFNLLARIWFPEGERITTSTGCAVSTSEFGYALAATGLAYLTTAFPMPRATDIPDEPLRQVVRSNQSVWVLAGSPDARQSMSDRVALAGFQERALASRDLRLGDAVVRLEGVKIEPRGEEAFPLVTWNSTTMPLLGSNTSRGRVDLPLVSLTPNASVTRVEVRITPTAHTRANCTAIVSDQEERVLERMPCGGAQSARWDEFVPVDDSITGLRLSFETIDDGELFLPREVILVERRLVGGRPVTH